MIDSGTWHLASNQSEFLKLQSGWERLFQENPRHSPFLAWGWVNAWLKHIARPHELQIIYLQDADGIVQYILPLHRPTGKFGIKSRRTMLVGNYGLECSDGLGCLCAPDLEDQSANLTARAINHFYDRNDVISLGFLDSIGGFPHRLKVAMQSGDRLIKVRPDAVCPAFDLPGSWDGYLGQLSYKFRSQVRRSCRQFGADGQPALQLVDAADVEAFVRDLIRLNRSRLSAKGETSSLEDRALRAFFEEAIPYMASHGIAWMDTIVQNREVLGSALHFVHGDTIYYYMGGFDDKARKMQPGTALLAQVMQRGIDNGFTRFDFLRGDEAYKYRWCATAVSTHNVTIYPKGLLRGHLASTLDDLAIATRKLLKYLLELIKRRG